MCFSAEASFAGAVVVGAVGIATLRQRPPHSVALIAAAPLAFAIHQLHEGVVWLALEDRAPAALLSYATFAYLLFAHVAVPALAGIAVLLDERGGRRRIMIGLAVVGAAVAAYLLYRLFAFPPDPRIASHSIEYQTNRDAPAWIAVPYVAATCLPFLLSRWVTLIAAGALFLIALVVTIVVRLHEFTSVWCFFAALTSVILYVHVRQRARAARPSEERAVVDVTGAGLRGGALFQQTKL